MDLLRTPQPAAASTPGDQGNRERTPGTLKDVETEVERLGKENFNLKLKIFFLEEKLYKSLPDNFEQMLQENIELKMELAGKKQELDEKNQLLVKARNAIESLQADLELARMQRLTDKQRTKLEEMPRTIAGLELRCRAYEDELERARQSMHHASDLTASQVTDLQRQLNREQENARSVEKALRSLEKEVSDIRQERDEARMLSSQKEREFADLRGQLRVTEDELARARAELKALAAQLQEERQEVAHLRNSLQAAELSMQDAASEIQKAARERLALEAKMQAMTEKISTEQDAKQRAARQVDDFKARLSAEEDEAQHLREQLQLQTELVDQLQKQLSQKSKLLTQALEACRVCEDSKKNQQEDIMSLQKRLQDAEYETRSSRAQVDALQSDWIVREQAIRQNFQAKEESLVKEWTARNQALEAQCESRIEQLLSEWRVKEMDWSARLSNQQRLLQASMSEQENVLQGQLIEAQSREQEQAARAHQLQLQLQRAMSTNMQTADRDTVLAIKEQELQQAYAENADLTKKLQKLSHMESELESNKAVSMEIQSLRELLARMLSAVYDSTKLGDASLLSDVNLARLSLATLTKEVQTAVELLTRIREYQFDGLQRATQAEEEVRSSARMADGLRMQVLQSAERERILNEQVEALQQQLSNEIRLRAAHASYATSLGRHGKDPVRGSERQSTSNETATSHEFTRSLEESNRLLMSELQQARDKYRRCREKFSSEKEDLVNRLREKETLLSKVPRGRSSRDGAAHEKHSLSDRRQSPALAFTSTGKNKVEVVFLRQVQPSKDDMAKAKQLLEQTGRTVSREMAKKMFEFP